VRAPFIALAREIVARENARVGGTAVARPAVAPSRLARVGFTGTRAPKEAREKSFADIRTPALRTDCEFAKTRCETANRPPGAFRFA
jgi:hypothetical protein